MAYVDKTYYDDTYQGRTISADDFADILPRAEEIINAYTNNDLYDDTTFAALNTFQTTAVKKAVCAQIEFIYGLGGYNAINSTEDNSTGFSLSKFKMETPKDNSNTKYQYFMGIPLSPSVNMHLKLTGLLSRKMEVYE